MNALSMLMTSRGTPMLLMGDEFGRSQQGNNNAYCIDSPLTWVDWNLLESNSMLFEFTQHLIRFRHNHPCLRINDFAHQGSKYFPSCSFHGTSPWQVNWSNETKQLAWLMSCEQSENGEIDTVYVATNTAHYATWFDLPSLPNDYEWQLNFNTGDSQTPITQGSSSFTDQGILVGERSVVIFSASRSET